MTRRMKILFVCLGNICRSPIAEGLFRHHLTLNGISHHAHDSCGTGGWHHGEAPDHRIVSTAARLGVDISDLRARKLKPEDFEDFDLMLGMDRQNVRDIEAVRPKNSTTEVALYLDYALGQNKDVPDPYYGGARDFETVFKLCDEASQALSVKL